MLRAPFKSRRRVRTYRHPLHAPSPGLVHGRRHAIPPNGSILVRARFCSHRIEPFCAAAHSSSQPCQPSRTANPLPVAARAGSSRLGTSCSDVTNCLCMPMSRNWSDKRTTQSGPRPGDVHRSGPSPGLLTRGSKVRQLAARHRHQKCLQHWRRRSHEDPLEPGISDTTTDPGKSLGEAPHPKGTGSGIHGLPPATPRHSGPSCSCTISKTFPWRRSPPSPGRPSVTVGNLSSTTPDAPFRAHPKHRIPSRRPTP